MLLEVNGRPFLTTMASQLKTQFSSSRLFRMLVYFALFSIFAILLGSFVAKLYEWRQDVLYGPYLEGKGRQRACGPE